MAQTDDTKRQRDELARLIKEHEKSRPKKTFIEKKRADGSVERRVGGAFASRQKYTSAKKSYENAVKKWESAYKVLTDKDKVLYDQENKPTEPKSERVYQGPPKSKNTYQSKDNANIKRSRSFLSQAKEIVKTWSFEAVDCFDEADKVRTRGSDFIPLSLDYTELGNRIVQLADKTSDSFKILHSRPEAIDDVEKSFSAALAKAEILIKKKLVLQLRVIRLVNQKVKQSERDDKKAEAENIKKAKERAKAASDKKKAKERDDAKAASEEYRNNQREIDAHLANLEMERYEIRRRMQVERLKKRGVKVRGYIGSLMGSIFSKPFDAFEFLGVGGQDEKRILGSLFSGGSRSRSGSLLRGIKSLFGVKHNNEQDLMDVNDEIFSARMQKRLSKYDRPGSARSTGGSTGSASAPSGGFSDGGGADTSEPSVRSSPFFDRVKSGLSSVKNFFSGGKGGGTTDFNRTDDDSLLNEVKKTNSILTDMYRFMKKTSPKSAQVGQSGGGLLGLLGGLLSGTLGGIGALIGSLAKPILSGLGRLLMSGVGMAGTLARMAISVLPTVLSAPVVLAAVAGSGMFVLLKKMMSQLDAPNYQDPKNRDLMRLQGGMLPGAGNYTGGSVKSQSTSNSEQKIVTSSSDLTRNTNTSVSRGDSTTINNKPGGTKATSDTTKESATDVEKVLQESLMKATEMQVPDKIEEDLQNQEQIIQGFQNFLEGSFLDKLIDGLSKVLTTRGGSGRSAMPYMGGYR